MLAFALPWAGCAKVYKTKVPTYEEARQQVMKGGPLVDKPVEVREAELFKDGKQQSISKDSPAPYTGVLVNNPKAREIIAVTAERDRLRKELEAARTTKAITKIIYEATMQRLKEEVDRTWWERNRGLVGLVVGIIGGGALVLGVLYAVTKGNGVTTAPHLLLTKPALVRW